MVKKRGLPGTIRMKHDHLVEELTERSRTSVIRHIPVDKIIPNLMQPRKDFGDLSELASSIKEKGVIEPIILRPKNGKFEIIAGERRFKAAQMAGLSEIPGIEYNIPDNEALEISIIENIQRKDLDVFEQAFSLKSLNDIYGYTHEEIAAKIGKSRVTVTELLRLTDLPGEIVIRCQEMKINSKSFLLELAKINDIRTMDKILDQYQIEPFSRDTIKDMRKPADDPNKKKKSREGLAPAGKFKYVSHDKALKIDLRFKKGKTSRNQVISVLEKLIQEIKSGKITDLNV